MMKLIPRVNMADFELLATEGKLIKKTMIFPSTITSADVSS